MTSHLSKTASCTPLFQQVTVMKITFIPLYFHGNLEKFSEKVSVLAVFRFYFMDLSYNFIVNIDHMKKCGKMLNVDLEEIFHNS